MYTVQRIEDLSNAITDIFNKLHILSSNVGLRSMSKWFVIDFKSILFIKKNFVSFSPLFFTLIIIVLMRQIVVCRSSIFMRYYWGIWEAFRIFTAVSYIISNVAFLQINAFIRPADRSDPDINFYLIYKKKHPNSSLTWHRLRCKTPERRCLQTTLHQSLWK